MNDRLSGLALASILTAAASEGGFDLGAVHAVGADVEHLLGIEIAAHAGRLLKRFVLPAVKGSDDERDGALCTAVVVAFARRCARPSAEESESANVLNMARFLGIDPASDVKARLSHLVEHREKVHARLVWLAIRLKASLSAAVEDCKDDLPDMRPSLVKELLRVAEQKSGAMKAPIVYTPLSAVRIESRTAATPSGSGAVARSGQTKALAAVDTGQLTKRIAELVADAERLTAERDSAAALAERRGQAIVRYGEDLARLRSRLALPAAPGSEEAAIVDLNTVDVPTSWADLELFASQRLAPDVILTSKSLRAARTSVFDNIAFAYRVLLLLREDYLPMKRGAPGSRERFERRAQMLRVEVSPTGLAAERQRMLPSYSVQFDGRRYALDLHVSGNSSRDPRTGFRLYFHYRVDEDDLLVGSFPAHLDNTLS